MIVFLHGLESNPNSRKSQYLETEFDAFCPPMDYRDSELFGRILTEVKERKPTLLIGSSMGGWYAYCISTLTGIPTLLFNPALHSRSIETNTTLGDIQSTHTIILGEADDVINPINTIEWIRENGVGLFEYHYEQNGHRTPLDIFKKWVDKNI